MATYIKPPLYMRAVFTIAKILGYEVRISRNTPFMSDYQTVIYIRKIANYLEKQ